MYIRVCPICNTEISYKIILTYTKAIQNNTKCKKCTARKNFLDMHQNIKNGLMEYGFSGKSHSDETSTKISNNVKRAFLENRLNTSGENNGMYGKTFISPNKGKSYDEIYGIEKSLNIRFAISTASSGENNGMYGKPSPIGSGNGWSGWYKNWYFRSLLELSFIVNQIERFKFKWTTGESIKIKYIDYDGKTKNYFPDFLINDKFLVEIKPKNLHNSESVRLKKLSAESYCEQHNLKYKLISPIRMSEENFRKLVDLGKVKLIDRYNKKLIQLNIKL